MHQFPSSMGDEHQHILRLEGQRRHGEQVGSPEMMSMVAQERPPGLAQRAWRSTPAVATNRAVADDDAQLEQFTSDPLAAPQPIVARYGRDQRLHLGTQMRPSASGTRLPAPAQAPAL